MLREDEAALICDLAETYHIYDYRKLPPILVSTLAVGLRDSSRIKMRLNDLPAPPDMMLMASIVDRLGLLVWMKTKDAAKGRNRPKSILDGMLKNQRPVNGFKSGDDFNAARQRLIQKKGGANGN